MKKLLISIILTLLLILIYFLVFNEISVFGWKSSNVQAIKDLSDSLDDSIAKATSLKNQEYPSKIEKLENSIKNLEKAKEKYENKIKYMSDNVDLGIIEVKQYKIERLWIVLQNYAKKQGIDLKLDVVETPTKDVYNLNITATGSYQGITDFIYKIEDDDTLGFKVLNFKMLPSTKYEEQLKEDENGSTTVEKVTTVYVDKITATFEIENVGIDFE